MSGIERVSYALNTEPKMSDQESKDRRDRLDRFVAAALTGNLSRGGYGKWQDFAQDTLNAAEAVLAEIERREKGGGQ